MIIATSSLSKSSVLKLFYVHTKTKAGVYRSSGLESVFENLRDRDVIVIVTDQCGR